MLKVTTPCKNQSRLYAQRFPHSAMFKLRTKPVVYHHVRQDERTYCKNFGSGKMPANSTRMVRQVFPVYT